MIRAGRFAAQAEPASRVVLDTNVCLDLFVYRDRGCAPLMAALQAGRATAVTDDACRQEWLHVLHYPQFDLDAAARRRATDEFDAQCTLLHTAALHSFDQVRLPLCSDADDQKFIQLAWGARASWLLTKDKALLKLARRTRKAGLFAIATPQDWVNDDVR